jgi:PhzF family phenazine biosynthesis protein
MGERVVQVDAFTDRPFSGNPAAVVVLDRPGEERWMQNVALEMNLSETAFLVRRKDGGFDLRWFTPAVEVDLCGHATLASAHVLWEEGHLEPDLQARFHTRSGILTADRRDGRIVLDFPATPEREVEPPHGLIQALGIEAEYVGKNAFDYLVEVDSENTLRAAAPDFGALRAVPARGIIVTARASSPGFDFVSRFFAPAAGIIEDPVTGSAHTTLGPFWAPRLGKTSLVAYQASPRGGIVEVELSGNRVLLGGRAVTVLRGELV